MVESDPGGLEDAPNIGEQGGEEEGGGEEDDPEVDLLRDIGDDFLEEAAEAQEEDVVDGGSLGQAPPDVDTSLLAQGFMDVAVRNAQIRGIALREALDEIERGTLQGLAPNPASDLTSSKEHTERRNSNEGKIGLTYMTKKKKKKLMKKKEVRE
jgi:hypothetical protein